jgi:hypothetical protein
MSADNGGDHIAHKKRVDLFYASILHGGKGGITPDLTQGLLPMLAYFCLTNSQNGYFSHTVNSTALHSQELSSFIGNTWLYQSQKNLNANYAKRRITRKSLFKFAIFVHSRNSRSKYATKNKTRQATLVKP